MEISDYAFGSIEIGGRRYTRDLIITPQGVQEGWWRKAGHRLDREDLSEVLAARPQVLVVGTGYYGNLRIPRETEDFLRDQGIALHAAPTGEAVQTFNALQREYARVVAALHLTC
jgi:hypothetical protein